jgi:PAS domain S-box-containing protein
MLVVSVPVEDVHNRGVIGYLVVGRYLDARELASLSESLGYQVSVGPGSLPGPWSPAGAVVFSEPDTLVVIESETEISGYRSVPGIGGTPSLLLKVTTSRSVHHYGLATMNYILLSLLLIGFIFGGAVLLLLEFSVLSRITRLSREVRQIGSSGNPNGRVTPEGNDEIASLAGAVNHMLTSLELSGENLEKSENRYAHLLNNANDCIFSITTDGTLLSCNRQMKTLIGSLGHEISVGKPLSQITSPEAARDFMKALAEGLAHGPGDSRGQVFNLVITASDGSEHVLETNAEFHELLQDTVPGYFCIGRDITERILHESSLVAVTKKLKLLGDITRHDIKNQLTVLVAYLEYLKMVDATAEREKIHDSLDRVTTRIHDQLEFTGDYQQLGVNGPTWQDLLITFKYAISHLDMAGIRQVIDVAPVEVFVDPLFEKALCNLVHNSLVHGDGVTEVRLTSTEQDRGLLVVYEDNGCGILPENKEKIFGEGFGKVNGFGLFLTKEILAITKISIKETGEPGTGARFELFIPRGRFRNKQGLP